MSEKSGRSAFFMLEVALPILAVLVWAGWQRIKPRRIWWTCANDPWGKRR